MSNRNISQSGGNGGGGIAAYAGDAPSLTSGRTLVIMVSVLLGLLLAALDQTVVGPALPTIIRELNGFDHYTWVVTIYLLTSTISVPIFGKLSDMYGRKWFYIAGIVVFLLGSGLAGLSGEVLSTFGLGSANSGIFELIAFRGLQGLGAGILTANAFAIIADLIPPAERGKWQGAFGAVFGLSSVIGPTIGGFLTDNWGWRWVFYVNLPIGIIALAVLVTTFPAGTTHTAKKIIDWWGALSLIAGLTPLLLALSLGGSSPDWAWDSSRVITMFGAAVVFLALFVFIESRVKEPIIPLDMFKNRVFSSSIIAVFLTGVGLFGAVIYLPLFIQALQGDTATSSGNSITPLTLAIVFSSIITGQVIARTGRYKNMAILGMGLVTVGMFLLFTMAIDVPRIQMIGYMIVMGLGLGVTFPLFTLAVQNAFPIQRVGVVTAALQFFRSVGSTVGVALLGTLVNNRTQSEFTPLFSQKLQTQGVPQNFIDQLLKGLGNLNPQVLVGKEGLAQLHAALLKAIPAQFQNFVDPIQSAIVSSMKPALYLGIQEAFLIGTGLMALGFVATLFLKEIPLRKSNARPSMASMAEGGAESFGDESIEAGREMAASGMPASELASEEEPELVTGSRSA